MPSGGTFTGNVFLRTQADIEIFGAHQYTEIVGSLKIGEPYFDTNIFDLSPLSTLTRISVPSSNPNLGTGRLRIHAPNITNLEGLNNITSLNGLAIEYCTNLEDISALSNLETIGGTDNGWEFLSIVGNLSLESLEGLNNLESIGELNSNIYFGLILGYNPLIENLDALSNLMAVHGIINTRVYVSCGPSCDAEIGNINLTDFCGLQNLFTNGIYGEVDISGNAYNPTVQDIIDGNCSL